MAERGDGEDQPRRKAVNVSLVPGIDSVRPLDVQHYLRVRGWVPRTSSTEDVLDFEAPGNGGARLRLLLDPTFSDYPVRMAELVEVLARWEERGFLEVLNDLLSPPGDRIRIRIFSESTRSGSILLEDSVRLRRASQQLLLASAHSALRPQQHFARLSSGPALEFLASCREVQTERGSYVASLLVPVDPPVGDLELDEPYPRRVTEMFMSALAHASEAVDHARSEDLLSGAAVGLSSNFLSGLAELRPSGERAFLEVGMTWSRTRPAPKIRSTAVRLEAGSFGYFKEAARTLRERTPTPGVDVDGFVVRLERAAADAPGDVLIATQLDEYGTTRVNVRLPAETYALAVEAHREGRRVHVLGTLVKEGRRFELREPSGFELIPE